MDKRVKTHIEPIMASAIVVTNGNQPSRIVLYAKRGQFITHLEMLTTETPTDGSSCAFKHQGFLHGGYFDYKTPDRPFLETTEQEALHYAQADFKERVRKLFHVG